MFESVLFYALGAVLILSGLRVITARNPVHGALFLVLAFFNAAGLWLLLQAEFLAIALVVVYVGAVMVLFLFVVMMLDINIEAVREGFWRNLPLALVVAVIMLFEMVGVLANRVYGTSPAAVPPGYSNTRALEYHGEKRGDLYYTKPMLLAVGDRYEEQIARDREIESRYR